MNVTALRAGIVSDNEITTTNKGKEQKMGYCILKDNEPDEGEFYEYWYDFIADRTDDAHHGRQQPDFGRLQPEAFPPE